MENTNLIFKCLSGSRAYGTNIETSDWDYKGVYVQPDNDILGFKYKEQIDVGKDESYYEIRRFVQLLQTANPTVLEMLFTEPDRVLLPWAIIAAVKEKFLTKKCLLSFGGYAVAQLKKAKGLNKKMNWEKEKMVRKTPLDFCTVFKEGRTGSLKEWLAHEAMDDQFIGLTKLDKMPNSYAIYYDWVGHYGKDLNKPIEAIGFRGVAFEDSNDVRLSSIPKGHKCETLMYYNKDAYSTHCSDYNSYQTWLENRNEQRYVDITDHEQKIDGKNMLHCVRLLTMCEEIVTKKTINVKRTDDVEHLKSIRKGEIDLNTLHEECQMKLDYLNQLYETSDLPETVSQDFCHDLVIKIRDEYRKMNISYVNN